MRSLAVLSFLTFVLCACNRQKPLPVVEQHPQMMYTNLHDVEVTSTTRLQTVDMDGDGKKDLWFSLQLVGDPIGQRDRVQYLVQSAEKRNLLNDSNDWSPVLQKFDTVQLQHRGYQWWEISSILLAEKIITYTTTYWEGAWKGANHQYLPVQFNKEGNLYHGWIELSFSMQGEKLVLHRAALSKEPAKSVLAGK